MPSQAGAAVCNKSNPSSCNFSKLYNSRPSHFSENETENNKKNNNNHNNKSEGHRSLGGRLISSEDLTFIFATMSWNVELLELLLAKANNPLHTISHTNNNNNNINCPSHFQKEKEEMMKEEKEIIKIEESCVNPLTQITFPSLEEALQRNIRGGGNKNRRSKRRKVGRRGRVTQLRLHSNLFSENIQEEVYEEEEEQEYNEKEKNEEVIKEKIELHNEYEHPIKKFLKNNNSNVIETTAETHDVYLTEEEEFDTFSQPHRCLEKSENNINNIIKDNNISISKSLKSNIILEENLYSSQASMREFIQLFYQSFLIIVAAQIRHQQQQLNQKENNNNNNNNNISYTRSLSPLEYRALCFIYRYISAFKEILRKHVICSEKEAERRGAQPLLVEDFNCSIMFDKEEKNWSPRHAQIYISGKEPTQQPLLLDFLDITRIVQCYADPKMKEFNKEKSFNMKNDMALNTLYSWRQLILEKPNSLNKVHNFTKFKENTIFTCHEEWDIAHTILSKCLSPFIWNPFTNFGPYIIYKAELPYSNRYIMKLILPAEDRESYDLSLHFQSGVFHFIHGTPLFILDDATRGLGWKYNLSLRHCCLIHCSAGMHRSSGLSVAYLLWLSSLSEGEIPMETKNKTNEKNEEKEGQHNQNEKNFNVTYLSAVLRHRQNCQNNNESISPREAAAAAAAATEITTTTITHNLNKEKESDIDKIDAAAESDTITEKKKISLTRRCIEHVQRQRSIAEPISKVQKLLHCYASHLCLE